MSAPRAKRHKPDGEERLRKLTEAIKPTSLLVRPKTPFLRAADRVKVSFLDTEVGAYAGPLLEEAAASVRTNDTMCLFGISGRRVVSETGGIPSVSRHPTVYESAWPRTGEESIHRIGVVADQLLKLDCLGIEMDWLSVVNLVQRGWDEAYLPCLRAALRQRGRQGEEMATTIHIVTHWPEYAWIVWRTTHTGPKGERGRLVSRRLGDLKLGLPGECKESRFCVASADIHAHWPTRITVDKCIVLHLNEHPTSSSICLSVEAAGTGMDYDTAHSAHVYVNFERPLRDVFYQALCLDPARIALVPFQFYKTSIFCAWFALRDAHREAIADAVFKGTDAGTEIGVADLVCDYLGLTRATATSR